jgi:hypothetical protein
MDLYELKWDMRRKLTYFCMWLIKKLNGHKDEGLGWELHNLAKRYTRRSD